VSTTTTTTLTESWLAREQVVLAPTLARIHGIVAESASGSWVTDVEGKRYLDIASGIGVTNVGHCHPKVVAAAEAQLRALMHMSVVTHYQANVALAEKLVSLCPFFERAQVFFCNSGAETIDGAIKLARQVTGRPGVIAFRGGFHGRTVAATSLTTAKGKYRAGYEPLLGGVTVAPYAYPLRFGGDDAIATERCLAELDELLAVQSPPANVAAMIVEPVLGEGGYVPPPVEWLAGLRERCDRHGILLIFDEVQCGVGRTGRPFAAETYGVRPDVILFAKGIASGLPLGGLIAEAATFDRWPPGTHGTTFGGNPVACAAALATLEVLDDEGLYERARVVGERALSALQAAAKDNERVLDVRGLGLMIGVELDSADTAAAAQQRCLDDGLIVLTCGPGDNVLRLIPPLTITDDEIAQALDILTRALSV